MRCLKKICGSLLALSVAFMMLGQTAFAADEDVYTYTVRLYAGNQGTLTGQGITVDSSSGGITASDGNQVVITGLKYGDTIYMTPQDAAKVKDDRYFVRNVRRSGRDNMEAEAASFTVACDRDYIISYGVVGDMVKYTVNYVDTNGNSLLRSDEYYGAVGDRQYVSARYVDGYQPQTLNMVKTLKQDESENVFDFVYTQGGAGGGAAGGTIVEPGTTTVTEITETIAGAAGGAAGGAGAGAAGAGGAGADEGGAAADAVGGDALVEVPDEDVPQSIVDLDDGEVPLSGVSSEPASIMMGYMPLYIGVGGSAAAALLFTAIYLKKRQKASVANAASKSDDDKRQS